MAPSAEEYNQLVALFGAGHHAELESRTRLLLERYPDSGFAWKALAASLKMQGKDSLPALQKATECLPNDAEAHNNLGIALLKLGRLPEAEACYWRVLELKPDYVAARGNSDDAQNPFSGAEAGYKRALELKLGCAEAYCNLGNTKKNHGQPGDAVASYRRALQVNPDFAEAHNGLGNALLDLGKLDDAVASYRRALEIKPDFANAHSIMLFACNLLSNQSPASMLSKARRYGELVAQQAHPYKTWSNAPEPARCLRVGFVSGDLWSHPVGNFLRSVLAALSAQFAGRLEFFAYYNHVCTDAVTDQIKACCRGWQSVTWLSDESLAREIRENGIDILIDLSGHTAHNRLSVFAWKPAPVQVAWLGYLATTGVAAMDYLIADPWTLPEAIESNFTEKIWRLPETYLCFTPPDADAAIVPLPALTNGYITFGCFNNLNKVNDDVVALWARVLASVPDSRLFLKAKQLEEVSAQQSIAGRFAAHGIGADRLVLKGHAPRAEYLALYQRVDIALDPFPYTGTTTSVEGLWMGVPMLTLAGESFLSRQGVGLLMNAGLPEWVAADADDYVARAVLHASDLQRLAALHNGLRQQVLASPIFDAPRFAHNFEAALRGMWQKWCGQQQAKSS